MSKSANVLSVQTLKDFKLAMMHFRRGRAQSLSGVDMELRRMRDWLERDQLGYWQIADQEAPGRPDAGPRRPAQAQDLAARKRRRLRRRAKRGVARGDEADCGSPRKSWRTIKRLIPYLHHAIDEYHSHSQPLGDHLSGGFEKSLFTLEKMIGSLEAYLALAAPTAPRLDSLPGDRAGGRLRAARRAAGNRRR